MVLFDNIIQIFHLPDGDVRAMLFVIAFDGGFIGVTAVNSERLRDPVPADRLLQKPQCGLCIPMLGEQKVNGLAVLIDRSIQIAPLPLDLDVGLVQPPADPYRAFTPVKRLFQQRAIFDGPPVDGGVIDVHPPFCHEFLDMAGAQRVRDIPAHPHENDLWGEMGPLKTDCHRRSPSSITVGHRGRAYYKSIQMKICDTTETCYTPPRHYRSPLRPEGTSTDVRPPTRAAGLARP